MPDRPPIPPEIKLAVRQRCCFGCVVCGNPIYQYEHFIPWETCRSHDAYNINLLCPDHHTRKGKLLPLKLLEDCVRSPFNCRRGQSKAEHLLYYGASYSIECGSNWLHVTDGGDSSAILIDGRSVLGFKRQGSALLLDLDLRSQDGTKLAAIEDNALTYTVDAAWDITFDQNHILTIRSAPRQVCLRIVFFPPDTVSVTSGQFWLEGHGVDVKPSRVKIYGNDSSISENVTENTDAVIAVGYIPKGVSASYELRIPGSSPQ